MISKFVLFFLIVGAFLSCSQRLKIPINRMISPEVIGGGADIELQRVGFSTAQLSFLGGETDNPLNITGAVDNRSVYFAGGVSQNVDVFIKIPQESSSLLGLKVQVLGVPSKIRNSGHQIAFTIAIGSERDSFEGSQELDVKSDVKDYSIIYGYRASPYLLGYASLSLSDYSFSGKIKKSSVVLLDNKIDYRAQNTLGGQLGIELGGESFALKLELAGQRVHWTNTEAQFLYSTGLALRSTF